MQKQKNWLKYPKKRFIRYKEARERYSMGRDALRIEAIKAGALYQIADHMILIDFLKMDDYIETNYQVKGEINGYECY